MEVNVAEETEVLFISGHSSGRNLIYYILDDGPRTTDFFSTKVALFSFHIIQWHCYL